MPAGDAPPKVEEGAGSAPPKAEDVIAANGARMIVEGRRTFRFETFGDEAYWSGELGLHRAIAGEARGGVGPGLSPKAALGLGLKVDSEALPPEIVEALQKGKIDLDDPGVTQQLIELDAVVGIKGSKSGKSGKEPLTIGVTCALCHSTVDDALAPGIGKRLDGYANRDLNVGAIVALSPNLSFFTKLLKVDDATVRRVLRSWGPGKFDPELILDGKAFRPDGRPAAVLIPPAYGLAGVNLATWIGWGSMTHWNAFVGNLAMHGKGTFFDPRLDDASRFPIAARERFGHLRSDPDLLTPRLAALHLYQLAIPAPTPPPGSFDPDAARRGQALFNGQARCATCHVPPLFTEPGYNMHRPEEIGIDDFQANRGPDRRYRTSPLKGLFAHQKGGFYHDGRFATLADVIDHYNRHLSLRLTVEQKRDLVEYLKSL